MAHSIVQHIILYRTVVIYYIICCCTATPEAHTRPTKQNNNILHSTVFYSGGVTLQFSCVVDCGGMAGE